MTKLELKDLDIILREKALLVYGHVGHSNGAVRTACDKDRADPGFIDRGFELAKGGSIC